MRPGATRLLVSTAPSGAALRLALLPPLAALLVALPAAAQDRILEYELRGAPNLRDPLTEQRLRQDPALRDRLFQLELRRQAEEMRRLGERAGGVRSPGGAPRSLPPGQPLPSGLTGVVRATAPGTRGEVATIRDLFRALRGCWTPPEEAAGLEITLRLAFRRSGEPIGEPRVTYAARAGDQQARDRFRRSVTEGLRRCTPLTFANGFGGAVAGRPITVRFVDDRTT